MSFTHNYHVISGGLVNYSTLHVLSCTHLLLVIACSENCFLSFLCVCVCVCMLYILCIVLPLFSCNEHLGLYKCYMSPFLLRLLIFVIYGVKISVYVHNWVHVYIAVYVCVHLPVLYYSYSSSSLISPLPKTFYIKFSVPSRLFKTKKGKIKRYCVKF